MIKYNTRLAPTPNGYWHLGHLYAIKVNEVEAHRTGGKFGIILDPQRYWNWYNTPEQREEFLKTACLDMQWAGIKIDYWSSTEDLKPKIEDLLTNVFHYMPEPEPFVHEDAPEVIGIENSWYPYTEELTTHKVIVDFLMGVNWLIRGWDLLGEFSHYISLVKKFKLPRVRQTFIPKLKFRGDIVSKTEGSFKIKDFREKGIPSAEVWMYLASDCLKSTQEGWTVDNIKTPWPNLGNWVEDYGFIL